MPASIALTDTIELRLLRREDAPAFYACALRNRERLRPWFDWVTSDMDLLQTQRYIAGLDAQSDPPTDYAYGFWDGATFAGSIGLHKIDRHNGIARIGYWIDAAYQGRGLVTRAVRALVNAAFGELGLNRIEIRCAPNNAASRAVPQRLGFVQEGTHRQVLAFHGGHQDLVMYAMLARDWSAQAE